MKIKDLYNPDYTIAKDLFNEFEYPWEVLLNIKEFICKIGRKLDKNIYEETSKKVWIAKSADICKSALIKGPCIIGECTEVRHNAFIRGSVIIGNSCIVGNSTEMKNAIIFDNVQIPHFNYVGDSILGYKVHLGAGAITSNVKCDKSLITVNAKNERIETHLKKFGSMIGDYTEVGCNSVLCPGSIIGKNCTIYPLSIVRGVIPENSIFKDKDNIISKRQE